MTTVINEILKNCGSQVISKACNKSTLIITMKDHKPQPIIVNLLGVGFQNYIMMSIKST